MTCYGTPVVTNQGGMARPSRRRTATSVWQQQKTRSKEEKKVSCHTWEDDREMRRSQYYTYYYHHSIRSNAIFLFIEMGVRWYSAKKKDLPHTHNILVHQTHIFTDKQTGLVAALSLFWRSLLLISSLCVCVCCKEEREKNKTKTRGPPPHYARAQYIIIVQQATYISLVIYICYHLHVV